MPADTGCCCKDQAVKNGDNPPSDGAVEALKQTADFVRLSSGLVTGTIAFSFVFLGGSVSLPGNARYWIFAAWGLLFLSLVLSIVVFSTIPPKFEAEDYTLYDALLNVFGIAHLVTFVIGFIVLAIGVGMFAFAQPSPEEDRVKTAQAAVATAIQKFPRPPAIVTISSIDLIKGTDAARSSFSTWRVHANINYPVVSCAKGKHCPTGVLKPHAIDVYINASSGRMTNFP